MKTRNCLSIGMLALCLTLGWSHAAQAAGDHFKALGPNKGQAASDDSLFYPSDYEAAVAARPAPNNLVLFSLCRRAPFTSSTLYAPLAGGDVDAIVGDTLFTLVDGTEPVASPSPGRTIRITPVAPAGRRRPPV